MFEGLVGGGGVGEREGGAFNLAKVMPLDTAKIKDKLLFEHCTKACVYHQ